MVTLKTKRNLIFVGGIIVLSLVSLIGGLFLVKNRQLYEKKAFSEISCIPQGGWVVNLHSRGFAVIWFSKDQLGNYIPSLGSIRYGITKDNLDKEVYDIRGQNTSSVIHYVFLTDLQPNTFYFFKINCGGLLYGKDPQRNLVVDGNPFSRKTLSEISLEDNPSPLYGEIKKGGQFINEAAVLIRGVREEEESLFLSPLNYQEGKFVIDLKNFRQKDGNLFVPEKLRIFVKKPQEGINYGREISLQEISLEAPLIIDISFGAATGTTRGLEFETEATPEETDIPLNTPSPSFGNLDLNNDDKVNVLDFVLFLNNYQEGNITADLNGDNQIDNQDLILFQQNFGR